VTLFLTQHKNPLDLFGDGNYDATRSPTVDLHFSVECRKISGNGSGGMPPPESAMGALENV
jgi:hypothetical protein